MTTETTERPLEWPFVFNFRKEVSVLGKTLNHLSLKEPSTEDGLEFGLIDGSIDRFQWVALIARLSGQPDPVIRALPATEVMRLIKELSPFLSRAAS